ncbi:MAG: PhoPQ-activated pathogenicity-related family protein [Candidatus Hydrogenedentes bacterium]|nr:PhoPQ-activated pathogenicity-related family protein [Candidatus Hydrogenedentota bacterium]
MRSMLRFSAALLLLLAISATGFARGAQSTARETVNPTPLDTYVYAPDDSYKFELKATHELKGCKAYVLDFTSQKWRTPEEIDRTEWKHWLIIYVPEEREGNTALLVISGGGNDGQGEAPGPSQEIGMVATGSKSVLAELKQIPNQPLAFKADGKPRKEDDFIAYTWKHFMLTGDANLLARMPMTKASVRAMDAVQEFMASGAGGQIAIKDFVVAGASKRGWTTWTTAAVDKRVVGMVPMVIDLLNLVPSFEHHWSATGEWAPAIGNYVEQGVMDWMGYPEFDAMMKIVDPYNYKDRLTIPKYLINSAGDQFFLPDSWKFYWNDLKPAKYLRYVPNTGHGLDISAYFSVTAFQQAVAWGKPLPEYSWSLDPDGAFHVTAKDKPTAVKLWTATNPESRVFRIDVVKEIWQSQDLEIAADGHYTVKVDLPEKGYTAYFVELTFPGPASFPLIFTTGVNVIPDTYPFEYKRAPQPEGGFLSKN